MVVNMKTVKTLGMDVRIHPRPRRPIQSAAPSLGVEVTPINLRDAADIERAVRAFSRSANGGLIMTASALSVIHPATWIASSGARGPPTCRLCSSSQF
jgi:hypothetical protein